MTHPFGLSRRGHADFMIAERGDDVCGLSRWCVQRRPPSSPSRACSAELDCGRRGRTTKTFAAPFERMTYRRPTGTGKGHLKGKRNPHFPKAQLDQMLVSGSLRSTTNLRERLIGERVLEARCATCGRRRMDGLPHPAGTRSHRRRSREQHSPQPSAAVPELSRVDTTLPWAQCRCSPHGTSPVRIA